MYCNFIFYNIFLSIKSWQKSSNIQKIKIHYYEKLIENAYQEYAELNLSKNFIINVYFLYIFVFLK